MKSPFYWYLVQRLEGRQPTTSRNGVDALVSHDYMGSAEFEWGAVPKAWKALRAAVSSGMFFQFEHPDLIMRGVDSQPKSVHVIMAQVGMGSEVSQVARDLEDLAAMKIHTKEWTDFEPIAEQSRNRTVRADAWLKLCERDRDIPVFFTTDKRLFDRMLAELKNPAPTAGEDSRGARSVAPSNFVPPIDPVIPSSTIDLNEVRLFDFVKLKSGFMARVVGIFEKKLKVERPDGVRVDVRPTEVDSVQAPTQSTSHSR